VAVVYVEVSRNCWNCVLRTLSALFLTESNMNGSGVASLRPVREKERERERERER
jgi:hypothetical protein